MLPGLSVTGIKYILAEIGNSKYSSARISLFPLAEANGFETRKYRLFSSVVLAWQ
jgi:hypothetical protein